MSAAEIPEVGRISGETVYAGRIIDIGLERIRLPNGAEIDLEVIRHPGASAVVPFLDDGRILLIRQYRFATDGWLLEVPAGKLDAGETPEACARRETEEEVGQIPGTLHSLGGIYTTPGFCDEYIHLFAATALTATRQRLESDEVLEIVPMALADALEMICRGEIRDAKTLGALLRADQEIRAGKLRVGTPAVS